MFSQRDLCDLFSTRGKDFGSVPVGGDGITDTPLAIQRIGYVTDETDKWITLTVKVADNNNMTLKKS